VSTDPHRRCATFIKSNIIQCLPLSFTRPPSSKRKIAGRAAAAHARNSKKRQKISTTAEIPDSCSEGGVLSGSDSEGIAIDSEPEDDVFVFHQPDNSGWAKAERQLKGYSKTNAGKTTQSRWYYSQKKKNQEKETAKLGGTYGSRFFGRKEKEDESTLLAMNQNPLHLDALYGGVGWEAERICREVVRGSPSYLLAGVYVDRSTFDCMSYHSGFPFLVSGIASLNQIIPPLTQ